MFEGRWARAFHPRPIKASSGNFLDERAATESDDRVLVSRSPSFGVTVYERNESSVGNVIHSTLEKSLIFVLAIDDADSPIIFDEGDGKELALGLSDQVVEFGLHSFRFVVGEIVFVIFDLVNFFLKLAQFIEDRGNYSDEADNEDCRDEGDKDFVHFVHLVCLVRCQVTGKECMKNGCVASCFWYFFEKKRLRVFCF